MRKFKTVKTLTYSIACIVMLFIFSTFQASASVAEASARNTSCVKLTFDLSRGSTDSGTNGEVSRFQEFMGLRTTGVFDVTAELVLKIEQSARGIPRTGVVDARTREVLGACPVSSESSEALLATPVTGRFPLTVEFTPAFMGLGNYWIEFGDGKRADVSCAEWVPDTDRCVRMNKIKHVYKKKGTYMAEYKEQNRKADTVGAVMIHVGTVKKVPATTTKTYKKGGVTISDISNTTIVVQYKDAPAKSYLDLLWKNLEGEFESVAWGVVPKKGKGKVVFPKANEMPAGVYKARLTDSTHTTVIADSAEKVLRTTTVPATCTLSISPKMASFDDLLKLSWTSSGGNRALWRQDAAARLLKLPVTDIMTTGSQAILLDGKTTGGIMPTLEIYMDKTLLGTCAASVLVVK